MKIIRTSKSEYSKIKSVRLNSPIITRILFVLIFLVLIALMGINVKLIIFLVAAIIFNSWLAGFQLKRGLPTDFELSTFSTVLTTMVFGWQWGIFIAIFSKLIASIYSGNIIADHFFMILTYLNAVLIISLLGGSNVILLGFITIIINCIIMFFISKNILGIDIVANFSYTGTNFVFNSIIFLAFSQSVYYLLTL